MADLFTLHSQSLPEDTRVVGFRGSEALSRPYAFEVFLQITGPDAHSFDMADAVGGKAALVASRDDDRDPFVLAGVFSEVALLHEAEERALVRALLVPRLWHLSQTLHSRIFTQQSIPDILEAVLKDNAFGSTDYELRLTGQYKPEEHVCQYGESDLDFVSRWMEREGLYYFFEHAEDGEKLVITDSKSSHKDLAASAIRYFPQAGQDVTAGEHLETFVCRHRQLPASVRFKDYDYNKPTLDVSGSAPVSRNGLGEIHLHGARVFTPDGAKRLAKMRAEQIQSRERVFTGTGTALYLRSGATFDLFDHPRSAFDAKYLAIEVEHQGNQLAGSPDLRRLTGLETDDVYRVHVTGIPADVQFRAEEATVWPRIYGNEHGVIDGDADSEYAQLDDHGRYLVRFAFDESGLKDGKASTWVRMMQPHGGEVEGWHFPLRKGTEVLFTFLGGDPDRPVIAGVVPNALKPSPVTRANHTKNVIRTGSGNEIVMDDADSGQFVDMQVPDRSGTYQTRVHIGHQKTLDLPVPAADPTAPDEGTSMYLTYATETTGSAGWKVGGHWWQEVGKSYFLAVGDDIRIRCGANHMLNVGGDSKELYSGNRDTTVLGNYSQSVVGHMAHLFGAGWTTSTTGVATHTVDGTLVEAATAMRITNVDGPWVQTIKGGVTQTVQGPVKRINAASASSMTYGATASLFLGATSSNFIGLRADFQAGAFISTKVAGEASVTMGARMSLTAGIDLKINASASVTVTPTWVENASKTLKNVAGPFLTNAATKVLSSGAVVIS